MHIGAIIIKLEDGQSRYKTMLRQGIFIFSLVFDLVHCTQILFPLAHAFKKSFQTILSLKWLFYYRSLKIENNDFEWAKYSLKHDFLSLNKL